MGRNFNVNIEAFPSYEKIYLYFDPYDASENDDFYEMEIDRDAGLLAKLLRKLRPMKDLQTPVKGFLAFATEILNKNVGSCICDQEHVNGIIDAYHTRKNQPAKEFETATDEEHVQPDFITESVVLREATWFEGKSRPAGSRLTFYHGARNVE